MQGTYFIRKNNKKPHKKNGMHQQFLLAHPVSIIAYILRLFSQFAV